MSNLKRQIKQIELELDLNKIYINQQFSMLKNTNNYAKFLPAGVVMSFIVGYIYSRKKTIFQLVTRGVRLAIKVLP